MVGGFEIIQFAGRFYDIVDPGITELNHLSRLNIDQVVMLHAMVGFFELRDVLAELVLDHQIAVQQQFNGIVQGGPADTVVLVLHEDIQRLYIEMTVT